MNLKDIKINTVIRSVESDICFIILYALKELPFNLGRKKIISFLRGYNESFMIRHDLHALKTYSLLQFFSSIQLEYIFSEMIEKKYITESKKEMKNKIEGYLLNISERGERILRDNKDAGVNFLDAIRLKNFPLLLNTEDSLLFEELKELRLRISLKEELRPYYICSDRTLRAISSRKPVDRESFLSIKGIGQKFIDHYSDFFLNEIVLYIEKKKIHK